MDLPRSNASMSAQNARCESCWVLEPHTRCIPGIPGVYPACSRRVPGLLACAVKPALPLATTLQHPHCVWDRGEGCLLLWPSAISWRRGLRAPVPCQWRGVAHLLHAHMRFMRTVAVTAFSERPLPPNSAQASRNNGIQVEPVAPPTCMARHAPPSPCIRACAPATPPLSPRCRGSSPHARQQPGIGY